MCFRRSIFSTLTWDYSLNDKVTLFLSGLNMTIKSECAHGIKPLWPVMQLSKITLYICDHHHHHHQCQLYSWVVHFTEALLNLFKVFSIYLSQSMSFHGSFKMVKPGMIWKYAFIHKIQSRLNHTERNNSQHLYNIK